MEREKGEEGDKIKRDREKIKEISTLLKKLVKMSTHLKFFELTC